MHTFFYGRLQLLKLSALEFWYGIFLVLGTQKYSTLTLSTYVPTTAQTCNVTIPRGAGSIVSSGVTATSPIQCQHNLTTVSAMQNPPALPQIDSLCRLRLHHHQRRRRCRHHTSRHSHHCCRCRLRWAAEEAALRWGALKECVHGDDYVNGCRQLAIAGSVTPCRALAYSWSNYIVKVSILMNYD
jgi:hypothetical protein